MHEHLRQAAVVPSERRCLYEKRSRTVRSDGLTCALRKRNRRGLREGVDILSTHLFVYVDLSCG